MQKLITQLGVLAAILLAGYKASDYLQATFARASELREVKEDQASLRVEIRDELKTINADVKQILREMPRKH